MSTAGADNFADATDLPFGSSSDPTPSASLTAETGEQFYYGYFSGSRTAWWKFTAPRTCSVNVDFLQTNPGSDPNAIQVYLAVWTGDTMGSLTGVTASDAPYDNTDAARAHLPEADFDATEGTTYYVQVSLDDSSLDVDLVLRVCESQFPWSDSWVQLPDYQLTDSASNNFTYMNSATYSAHRDTTYPKFPTTERSNHLEDLGKKLARDAKFYDSPGTEPATSGIVITTDNFADPAIYIGDAVDIIYAVKIKDDVVATYRTSPPDYHYNWQWQSASSTLTGISYPDWGIGSHGLFPYVTLSIGFRYVDGITQLNFDAEDQWTLAGDIVERAVVGTDGYESLGPKEIDMSHMSPDDRIFAFSTHIEDITVEGGLDLDGLNVYAMYGPGGASQYATFTLRPPLVRFQDKVLVSEGGTFVRTWLRERQRGDKAGAAIRTVQNNSQQNSLRNIGFR